MISVALVVERVLEVHVCAVRLTVSPVPLSDFIHCRSSNFTARLLVRFMLCSFCPSSRRVDVSPDCDLTSAASPRGPQG